MQEICSSCIGGVEGDLVLGELLYTNLHRLELIVLDTSVHRLKLLNVHLRGYVEGIRLGTQKVKSYN